MNTTSTDTTSTHTTSRALLATVAVLVAVLLGTAPAISVASEAGTASAAENGGMSPEMVAALIAINLDKDQRAPFATELRKFSADLKKGINRISRKRNPNQPRAIKAKARALTKKMDKAMSKILREDQWPAYEAYKTEFAVPPQLRVDSREANAGFQPPPIGQ